MPCSTCPRELVHYLARLLTAERRAIGTPAGTRALTCHYQAIMVLVWFRKGEDKTLLAPGSAAPHHRPAHAGLATSSAPPSSSHNSNTGTYRILAEITSMHTANQNEPHGSRQIKIDRIVLPRR